MTLGVFALVLGAAFLHASWNAVLRGGTDRLWAMVVMSVPTTLFALLWIATHGRPATGSWAFIAASATLQVAYTFTLTEAYRTGALAQVYPVARGSAPLLVTIGAALFAGEWPGAGRLVAVALISGGILMLARRLDRTSARALTAAAATGATIAAYTTVDGMGVRLAGDALTYGAWMLLLYGMVMPAIFVALRGAPALVRPRGEAGRALGGGVLSLVTYGTMVFALSRAPIASVAALRETSVVFAALLGHTSLGERLTRLRAGACVIIAAGAGVLAFG